MIFDTVWQYRIKAAIRSQKIAVVVVSSLFILIATLLARVMDIFVSFMDMKWELRMKKVIDRTFIIKHALLLALLVVVNVSAQGVVGVGAGFQPQFRFSNSNNPIIEYTQSHYMLAEQDPTPLLRVYGNGRVHIHFPAYMKRAGDYELWLSTVELNNLLGSLSQDGIMDFDHPGSLKQRQQLEAQQRVKDKMLFHVSDTTESVININLDEYTSTPQGKRIVNMKKKFSWKNLEHDARRFPQSTSIQGAAAGEKRIRSLLDHPNLLKLK